MAKTIAVEVEGGVVQGVLGDSARVLIVDWDDIEEVATGEQKREIARHLGAHRFDEAAKIIDALE